MPMTAADSCGLHGSKWRVWQGGWVKGKIRSLSSTTYRLAINCWTPAFHYLSGKDCGDPIAHLQVLTASLRRKTITGLGSTLLGLVVIFSSQLRAYLKASFRQMINSQNFHHLKQRLCWFRFVFCKQIYNYDELLSITLRGRHRASSACVTHNNIGTVDPTLNRNCRKASRASCWFSGSDETTNKTCNFSKIAHVFAA